MPWRWFVALLVLLWSVPCLAATADGPPPIPAGAEGARVAARSACGPERSARRLKPLLRRGEVAWVGA